MTTNTNRPGAPRFIAFEFSLEIIAALKVVVARIEKKDAKVAKQIVSSASSVAANLAEGSRRRGLDRMHFYRIAAGSAEETRAHLRVALAWGWVAQNDIDGPLAMIDRQLGMIWRLTR